MLFAASQSTAATASEQCRQAFADVKTAQEALDAERAAQTFEQVEKSSACTVDNKIKLGRNVALIFYRLAYSRAGSPDEQKRLLDRALHYGRPWQVLAWAADLAMSAKRAEEYENAVTLYQDALDDIRDSKRTPKAPPPEVIAAIHKKAQAASLLSPTYVRQINRAGEPSGLSCTRFRGYEPRATAVPVQFEYNSTAFTQKGEKAVKDMLFYLRKQGEPDIQLIGHTDPRGTREFNQSLSLRRAAAVKDYLQKGGYRNAIRITGRGEDEPFKADDPEGYSEEERYQLDRRVELVRKSGVACSVASY